MEDSIDDIVLTVRRFVSEPSQLAQALTVELDVTGAISSDDFEPGKDVDVFVAQEITIPAGDESVSFVLSAVSNDDSAGSGIETGTISIKYPSDGRYAQVSYPIAVTEQKRTGVTSHWRKTIEIVDGTLTFVKGKMDEHEVDQNDVVQGITSNCYFLAAVAEHARSNPDFIQNVTFGDGQRSIAFFNDDGTPQMENGKRKFVDASDFTLIGPASVRLSGDTVEEGIFAGYTEVWANVLELAYMKEFHSEGYGTWEPGSSSVAWTRLTGQVATSRSTTGKSNDEIAKLLKNYMLPDSNGIERLVIIGTYADTGSAGLVGNHAYNAYEPVLDGNMVVKVKVNDVQDPSKNMILSLDDFSAAIRTIRILPPAVVESP